MPYNHAKYDTWLTGRLTCCCLSSRPNTQDSHRLTCVEAAQPLLGKALHLDSLGGVEPLDRSPARPGSAPGNRSSHAGALHLVGQVSGAASMTSSTSRPGGSEVSRAARSRSGSHIRVTLISRYSASLATPVGAAAPT